MRADNERSRSKQKGIAMIVVLLVMVIMTLLGIPFLLMGETENRIAENERLSLQALYAAESGAKMAVRWFDRPDNLANVMNPTLAVVDRTQRKIDADGNPATAAVQADGTAFKPWYKQDVDNNSDGNDDIFRKPYRPSLKDMLAGTEDGPDMVIDETASSAAKTFLEDLSQSLFGDYPAGQRGVKARITRIDFYQPPSLKKSGVWRRYGVGTIKVVARIYQEFATGTEEVLAERMVKMVINEIPYSQGDLGPLHSCDTIGWSGDFTVHWGISTASSDADLANNHDKLTVGLPRVVPPSARVDLFYGWNDDAAWDAYYVDILETDGYRIDDPWLRFISGGTLAQAPGPGVQPWAFTWNPGDPIDDGDIPYHPGLGMNPAPVSASWDGTHSNMMHNLPVGCPSFPYEKWKEIALDGGLNVHYYTWDHDDYFKENGKGTARSFRDITDGQTGVFFFDTVDQLAPHDDNGDGVYDNLTPEIKIAGGTWGARGMIYLNAFQFQTTGVNGRPATFAAPGEPFQDKNQNGKWDTGERWVNLAYPTQLKASGPSSGHFVALAESPPGSAVRDDRGPQITDDALFWGIFYTSGYYDATGNGVYYGSLVANEGIAWLSPTSGTPDHYFDQSVNEDWPPDDWGLPRVQVSRWETDL